MSITIIAFHIVSKFIYRSYSDNAPILLLVSLCQLNLPYSDNYTKIGMGKMILTVIGIATTLQPFNMNYMNNQATKIFLILNLASIIY